MSTKFSEIYKKELKSSGILSSLGTAALEMARERLDIRNMLFGGTGVISATGQKIFGKGYSATRSIPQKVSNVANPSSSPISDQIASSMAKQEMTLRIIAKNTLNMNYMARDMNIMRQNIVRLTRAVSGKSSKKADALFFTSKRRDSILSNKTSLDSSDKTKTNVAPKSTGNSTSYLGSLVGGLIGGVGSGILGALRGVLAISPILGIIGIAGSAYVIKELAKTVDFDAIKDRIMQAIGIDPKSEKSFTQQLAEKLDSIFKTTKFTESLEKFTESLDWIKENFNEQINLVGKTISKVSDMVLVYTQAAYKTLADSFSNMGKIFAVLFNEFFQSNKGKIYMAIATGLAAGSAKDPRSAVIALAGIGIAGLFGAATGEKSRDELREEIDLKMKDLHLAQMKIDEAENAPNTLVGNAKRGKLPVYYKEKQAIIDKLSELGSELTGKESKLDELLNPNLTGRFSDYVTEGKSNLPGGEYGGGYAPVMRPSSTSPEKVDYASRVATNESGGNYDTIFGKAGGAMINGKLITENTISEVVAWQKSERDKKSNKQAAGKYQFMDVGSAAIHAGLKPDDLFNGPNQEKMMQAYTAANAKRLQALGLPSTPEYLSMAHAVGADGAKKLIDAQKAGEGSKNTLTILGLKGTAAETNPQLNTSVDNTIARLKSIGSSASTVPGREHGGKVQQSMMLPATPSSGSALQQGSRTLEENTREMSVPTAPTVIVKPPSAPAPVSSMGGGSVTMAGVLDDEFARRVLNYAGA